MTKIEKRTPRVAPPPVLDAELEAGLVEVMDLLPRLETLEDIPRARSLRIPDDKSGAQQISKAYEQARVEAEVGDVKVPVIVFTKRARPDSQVPAFLFIHGGGMYRSDPLIGIGQVLDWADRFDATVIAVDYRVAPENPHPAPVSDCYTALLWLADNATALGVDFGRSIVVGISAGGGLAAACMQLARDRGGPYVRGQLLMCPMLDDRNDTYSAYQMQGHDIWDRSANEVGWTALLGSHSPREGVSPYASPARQRDLSNLPATFIDAGSAETFRDEVVEYASQIWRASGDCELHVWSGAFHGFDTLVPEARVSVDARRARMNWLERHLADRDEDAPDRS